MEGFETTKAWIRGSGRTGSRLCGEAIHADVGLPASALPLNPTLTFLCGNQDGSSTRTVQSEANRPEVTADNVDFDLQCLDDEFEGSERIYE